MRFFVYFVWYYETLKRCCSLTRLSLSNSQLVVSPVSSVWVLFSLSFGWWIPIKAAQKTTRERGITSRKTNYAGLCRLDVFDFTKLSLFRELQKAYIKNTKRTATEWCWCWWCLMWRSNPTLLVEYSYKKKAQKRRRRKEEATLKKKKIFKKSVWWDVCVCVF